MKNIRDTCIEFLKNEDIKQDLKELMKPLVNLVYNELYLYIWFICLYNVFLIFINLAILFLVLWAINKKKIFTDTL